MNTSDNCWAPYTPNMLKKYQVQEDVPWEIISHAGYQRWKHRVERIYWPYAGQRNIIQKIYLDKSFPTRGCQGSKHRNEKQPDPKQVKGL